MSRAKELAKQLAFLVDMTNLVCAKFPEIQREDDPLKEAAQLLVDLDNENRKLKRLATRAAELGVMGWEVGDGLQACPEMREVAERISEYHE